MYETRKPDGFESQKLFVLPDFILEDVASHPITSSLYVTDIGFFPEARHHYRERPEGCDAVIVIYCAIGKGWLEIGQNEKRLIEEQTVIIIPENTPHRYGADKQDPWSIYWFHAKGEHIAEMIRLYDLQSDPITLSPNLASAFLETFSHCYGLLVSKPYAITHHVYVSQSIGQLLCSLGLEPNVHKNDRSRSGFQLDRAMRYLTDHLHGKVTLDDLSAHTCISRQHLHYLFKQATGFAPIDYFLRMKMQRACQLLNLTEQSIKEISHSLGYQDPYYFSRLFKKIIHVSPSEYRLTQRG